MVGVLAFGMWSAASAAEMRIQFAEKVTLPAVAGHVDFDAYGRRFSVDLESNDRLQNALRSAGAARPANGHLLRGKLQSTPGSWVRLSKFGDGIEGAIWDGRELYVVTSLSRISANLVQQPDGVGDTVIYRLSDTEGALPEQFCGVEARLPASGANAPTALKQYESLVADLRANALTPNATEQLDISIITDAAFQDHYGNLAHDAILSRINMVDGIFSEQVGILLMPSELHTTNQSPEPFNSNNPATLLESLADYREATPAVRASGLAHLITGRDLDGNVVGIAFRDSLCEVHDGVSLSDSSSGSFYGALIMAHELGHNFGAEHDGQAGSACAATPANFLMAPAVNSSGTFSQCSVQAMQGPIARARGRCIGALRYADLTLDVPASPFAVDASAAFSLPVTVRSIGTLAAQGSVLRIDLPSEITFDSVPALTCTVTGSVVLCPIGSLATGETRSIDVRLRGVALRTFTVTVSVEADNDFLRTDNVKSVTLGLQSSIDAGVSIAPISGTIFANDLVAIDVDVSSLRTQAVRDARLRIEFQGVFDSIDAGPHSCSRSPQYNWLVECTLADIAPGATSRLTVRVRHPGAFPATATAIVLAPNDGEFSNNRADRSYTVRAEREVTVSSSASESLRAVVGSTYPVTYTVTTLGRLPANAVRLNLRLPTAGEILSVSPSASTCSQPTPQEEWVCAFGTLAPGDVRTVVVSYRFHTTGTSGISAAVQFADGTSTRFSSAFTWVYSSLTLDASVEFYSLSPQVSEGETGRGNFHIWSEGFDPSQNVVVTFDIPAPARLSNLSLSSNPSNLQCVIVNPQRGRCTGSFVSIASGYAYLAFDFTSDVAVEGMLHVTITSDGDVEPSNNSFDAPFRVLPLLDVGLAADLPAVSWLVGQDTSVDFVVTTGRNAVPAVRLDAPGETPYLSLLSIRVNGNDCPLVNPFGPFTPTSCVLGDLPANASVPVTVTYRTLEAGEGYLRLTVSTARDSDFANNVRQARFRTMQLTDVQLQASPNEPVAGEIGATFFLPLITVSNSAAYAFDTVVEIPLPTFVQVAVISSNGSCSGTTLLRCSFPGIPAGTSASVSIRVTGLAAGSFTSNVRLTAANDSTSGNNAASVTINVTAPPPVTPPASGGSSGGGKSGGGGSLEWSGLALLALLAAMATARRSSTRTRCAFRPATTTAR
jgi:hypothetical protein